MKAGTDRMLCALIYVTKGNGSDLTGMGSESQNDLGETAKKGRGADPKRRLRIRVY